VKSIWVVEDDSAVREFVAEMLSDAGFSVTAIHLADAAYKELRSTVPDLIVLDLGMPQDTMEGMELLARLREADEWRAIPVVILSAFGDVVNRDITTRLGVTAILSKPLFDFGQLTRVIRETLG
jgi:DNA-binding response OmpR family regulator